MPILTHSQTETTQAEQRVVLQNISWSGYEQILQILGDHRSSRLIYDAGLLEITMPTEEHERSNELITRYIAIFALESGYNLKSMGSTTLNFPNLQKGAEPDKCHYIQNEPLVRGKTVDLNQDPQPDLVVEVDITHSDINKFNLYGSMGIPELWRYNGKFLGIYHLGETGYTEVESSSALPKFSKENLYQLLGDCKNLGESQALKNLQASIRSCH
ncbi:hypothetical protein Syn7502_02914 [Synechococcus sp. PCC 7502]|uniref:Uma2 family endonuclease n=1 Tax=Synechococcus sp. PCC 7502 TaxID=1173263 RepID=UPI00029FB10F|nr:Uma2 family endonuclease [Synechococcus sp. PCC 7502]AFY74839.1 hypothetical protein Syn7502_02914 [Synechococcus sp. PCC 7502]